jgi:riboflavin kinase/FMN adenylyltransferase
MCATSIGTNPTFDGTNRTIEAFVLDYQGNLYESVLTLEFVQKLRNEEHFKTIAGLQSQIQEDVRTTRTILGEGVSRGEHDR